MEKFIETNKFKGKKNFINKSIRNYGIDLLRMFSMINIIILHINLYSGKLTTKLNNIFKIILVSLIFLLFI